MTNGGRRALAVVAAVAIVGGAIVVRNALDDDPPPPPGRAARLLCASELATVCDSLEQSGDVEVLREPAGVSVERLSTLPDSEIGKEFDGWLVPGPEAEIVSGARRRAGLTPLFDGDGDTIARSPLLLAMWKDRAAVLAQRCAGTVTLKCVGEVAGTPWSSIGGQPTWGGVKPSHDDPATTATGLLTLGAAACSYFGKCDMTAAELRSRAFSDWFSRLESSLRKPTGRTALQEMLSLGASAMDVVATTEAEACPAVSQAASGANIDLIAGDPVAVVDLVFVPAAGGKKAGDLGDLVTGDAGRRAARDGGWRVDGKTPKFCTGNSPKLTDDSNIPSPGTLVNLQDQWEGVRG